MTLQQLEYILALNRLGNFAKAADYCDVTQPTLSSMIQKLENELGIKIFDRRRQPIVTTKAGQAVIRQAKEVLYQSRRLKEIVEEEKDTYLGTFTIGVLPTIAPYLIPHFFPQLMREHPEMDLRIVEMKTKDMKQALLNGDIDVGILAKIEGLEMFNSTHLYTEKYFAYISKNNPLFAKERIKTTDLNGEFLWLLDEGALFPRPAREVLSFEISCGQQESLYLGEYRDVYENRGEWQGRDFHPRDGYLTVGRLTKTTGKALRLAGASTRDRHDHRRQLHSPQDARHDREAHPRLCQAIAVSL